MADLNIRNVDIRLMVRLKSDALMAGLTLREHCIHLLSKTGGRQAEVGEDDTLGEVQDADVAVERSESVAVVSEVRGRIALGRERVEGGMPEAVRVRPEVVAPVSAGAMATKPVDVAASLGSEVIDFDDVGEIPEEILRGLVFPGERVVSVAPVSVEVPLCLHQWWEEGEQFECLMDRGHREAKFNKHGLHKKVRKISE